MSEKMSELCHNLHECVYTYMEQKIQGKLDDADHTKTMAPVDMCVAAVATSNHLNASLRMNHGPAIVTMTLTPSDCLLIWQMRKAAQ